MKKKIISVVLSSFLIFSNVSSSFANPVVVAPTISYELLMGLMGIGLSFGLALPKTDDEYYDYTKSLRNHLRLVDDDYLKELDNHFKNNNGNDKRFQVPYIPGVLEKLFDDVGKEVSKPSIKHYNDALCDLPINTDYRTLNENNSIVIPFGDIFSVSYVNANGNSCNLSLKFYSSGSRTYFDLNFNTSDGLSVQEKGLEVGSAYKTSKILFTLDNPWKGSISPGVYLINSSGVVSATGIPNMGGALSYEDYYLETENKSANGTVRDKTVIEYNPTSPNVDTDNNIITIPSIPNISIPNSDSLPSSPPFNVSDPLEIPSPNPGGDTDGDTNPGEDPGGDKNPGEDNGNNGDNFPSFPNMGDSLDFSPLYLSNITEKFPFSLPWDFKRIIDMFDVEPVAPKFEVPLVTETIEIDFSYFEDWAMIIRFFIIIIFTSTLIFISTKLKG